MATLSDNQAQLFLGKHFGSVATIRPDGAPHVTPVWVDWDGECVLVNTAVGRVKDRHLRRNPRATVLVFDNEDPERAYVEVTGRTTLVGEGADEHVDALSRRYAGVDFPRTPGQQRVIIKVQPDHVHGYGAAAD